MMIATQLWIGRDIFNASEYKRNPAPGPKDVKHRTVPVLTTQSGLAQQLQIASLSTPHLAACCMRIVLSVDISPLRCVGCLFRTSRAASIYSCIKSSWRTYSTQYKSVGGRID